MTNEEIDWTYFTFQHGFRILPQQSSLPGLPGAASHTPTGTHMTDSFEAGTPLDPQLLPVATKQDPAEHAVPMNSNQAEDNGMHAAHAKDAIAGFGTGTHQQTSINNQGSAPPQQQAAVSASELTSGGAAAQQAQDSNSNHGSHPEAGLFEAQHEKQHQEAEEAQLQQAAQEEQEGHQGQDEGEGEGEAEVEGGSDDDATEAKRLTRSRRNNAAQLFMLDHGSQLVPRKVWYTHMHTDMLTTVCVPGLVWLGHQSHLTLCHSCAGAAFEMQMNTTSQLKTTLECLSQCATWAM